MAYKELIKDFNRIRSYMREFYVYGLKSREEYTEKSARSYDDERRRMESWLGDYMRFEQNAGRKTAALSVDSRVTRRNPLYKAWKTKSFTDGDITLHFAIFDVLCTPEIKKTLAELVQEIDILLASRMTFDESTLRKKLKEYAGEGIIRMEKDGRRTLYRRSPDVEIAPLADAIDFFSEVALCGVIGSFLQDREPPHENLFSFKHHYITQAMDSDVMATLFTAIRGHRYITIENLGKYFDTVQTIQLVPLRIYISTQNGRQNLLAFHEKANRLNSYRLDYISSVRIEDEICGKFESLRKVLDRAESHMWGVNSGWNVKHTEHVEFEIRIQKEESFIVRRLEREKRCGHVEKLDDSHYRYTADVFDTREMVPWIRTFICRLTRLNFSNRTVENELKTGIQEMYRMYGIDGGDGHDFQ